MKKINNVLIACEESQVVCEEFRKLGVKSFSCDIQECSGGHPEWHILGDVLPLIDGRCEFRTMDGSTHIISGKWDLLIAHPPCTYLSNAAAARLFPNKSLDFERYTKGLAAKDFFMTFYNADCDHICIENPVPSKIYSLPKYTQVVNPFEFGEPYKKRTCLWLKGLYPLQPTLIVSNSISCMASQWFNSGSGFERQKNRSKTFKGIAAAMASQWSCFKYNQLSFL